MNRSKYLKHGIVHPLQREQNITDKERRDNLVLHMMMSESLNKTTGINPETLCRYNIAVPMCE